MDTTQLISKLKAAVPGAIMDKKPLGRSGQMSVWIEMRKIQQLAGTLKNEFGMDWLENLSVMEIEGALLLSYFVRSSDEEKPLLILRGTVMPKSPDDEVEVLSVVDTWAMAQPMERENTELFGIAFVGNPLAGRTLLPPDWIGFPLRKSYVFPAEYGGILHMRPVGHTEPDEHGATQ